MKRLLMFLLTDTRDRQWILHRGIVHHRGCRQLVRPLTPPQEQIHHCHLLSHVPLGPSHGDQRQSRLINIFIHRHWTKNQEIINTFQGGVYIFQLMDFYSASGMSILWVCFFQTIAISWIFGARKFCDCIHQMMGIRLNNFWYVCWVVFAPVIMAVSIQFFKKKREKRTGTKVSYLSFSSSSYSNAFNTNPWDMETITNIRRGPRW